MFFDSFAYLLFLPLAGIILYILPGRYQWLWLLACSSLFYFTLLPYYLVLFFALVIINYFLGIAIEKAGDKRRLVYILGICTNISVLALFKYFGFLESIISDITELSLSNSSLKLILPVGLSFFIFSILSYLFEIKRETIHAEKHLGIFASSMLFFPKIMQGPIERPDSIIPQFRERKSFSYNMVSEGVKLMLWGYFKKLVVAERLSLYVNAVYGNVDQHNGITLLVATLFYSFQIYADFSGYTDIALGSAKILGFNLTNNFKRPYFASSIKEFWSRWHISFSTWLRDYLFLPIAFYFAGRIKKLSWLGIASEKWIFLFAVNITFIVCGLWHGEGLNFLIWGLLFGIYQTTANLTSGVNKEIRKALHISKKSTIIKFLDILITFVLVSFAWIFFRADNTGEAFQVVRKIFSLSGGLFIEFETMAHGLFGIILLLLVDYAGEATQSGGIPFKTNHWIKELAIYASLAAIIMLTGVLDGGQFIYFQF